MAWLVRMANTVVQAVRLYNCVLMWVSWLLNSVWFRSCGKIIDESCSIVLRHNPRAQLEASQDQRPRGLKLRDRLLSFCFCFLL